MQLIERYLQAIEFWLPKRQSRDIIAEISEDIHSQVEDRKQQLGRDLTEAELVSLIQQRGRPILVANRYVPQRSLIGPALFPVYLFVLRVFALGGLVPWLAVFLTLHRIQHAESGWGATAAAAWGAIWSAAFVGGGIITLVFAVLERLEPQQLFLRNWNPRHLPPAYHPDRIPRASSVFELVVQCAGLAWWLAYASSRDILAGPAIRVSLTPTWMYFFWAAAALGIASIAVSVVALARPYWTVGRAACRTALDAVGGVLFCWLLKADLIAAFEIPRFGPARTLAIQNAMRYWIDAIYPLMVIAVVVIVAIDVHRVIRVNRKRTPLNSSILAGL